MENDVVAVNNRDQVMATKKECRRRHLSREEDGAAMMSTKTGRALRRLSSREEMDSAMM